MQLEYGPSGPLCKRAMHCLRRFIEMKRRFDRASHERYDCRVLTCLGAIRLPWPAASTLSRAGCFDVVIDEGRRRITVRGRQLKLGGKRLAFRIIVALFRSYRSAGATPVSSKGLLRHVWGRALLEGYSLTEVYFQVHALRRMLSRLAPDVSLILTTPEGYVLNPACRYALVPAMPGGRIPRTRMLLGILARSGCVDAETLAWLGSSSRVKARKDLEALAARGTLTRIRAGRRVSYRLSGPAGRALSALRVACAASGSSFHSST
jgi:DNA-binding winged helix-turn-helix (wHTH) protein